MKIIYLVPFLLFGTPFVFADDVYRGDTYQVTTSDIIINGQIESKWIGGLTPYISSGNLDSQGREIFVPYLYSQTTNSHIIETNGVSWKINKNTCTIQVYNDDITSSSIPVIGDVSYTLQEEINGIWTNTSHNNLDCNITTNLTEDQIQIITKQGNNLIGFKEIEYIQKNGHLETFLRSPVDIIGGKVYGFAESQIKMQDISINGTKYNLASENIQLTIDELKIIEGNYTSDIPIVYNDEIIFDTKDVIHDTLTDVSIQEYNNNLQVVYDYHNTEPLQKNTRLEIDPTFSSSSSTNAIIKDEATGVVHVCDNGDTKTTTANLYVARWGLTTGGSDCSFVYFDFDTSSIPDGSVVSDSTFTFDVQTVDVMVNCDIRSMGATRASDTASNIFTAVKDGTTWVSNNSFCTTASDNVSVDLGTTADAEIQSKLSSNFITFGIRPTSIILDASERFAIIKSTGGTPNPTLEVTYTSTHDTLVSNLTCTGQPYYYACTWDVSLGTGNTGYYIQTSINNSTWYSANATLIGNTTSGNTANFYGINDLNYIRVNGTSGSINGTESNHVLVSTDNYPDTPSITASSSSTTQIDITRIAGASNGGDTITHYDLRCEKNNTGGWLNTVTNGTIANYYNYTGLAQLDSLTCQWRDRNAVGYSSYSANATAQTNSYTSGTLSFVYSNVGDIFLFNGTLSSIISSTPASATQIQIISDGSIVGTKTITNSLPNGGSTSLTFIPYQMTDSSTHSIYLKLTATNNINGTNTINSNPQSITKEYNPSYFIADDPTQGSVNYTISRTSDQDEINLKTNRDKSGASFNIECQYRSMTDAALNSGGTWHNYTSVYFMNDTLDDAQGTHYYIDCYNDGLLFQVVSYTNSSMLLAGIEVFDDTYGTFIGVPVGVFFIVLVAGMANQRTAPMWIIVILAIAGIMSAIGFFTLETNVWALALIAALLGIIVGRKLF